MNWYGYEREATDEQDPEREHRWREHVWSVGYDGYVPFHGYELEVPNEQDSERKLCWREYVVRSAISLGDPSTLWDKR